MSAEQLIPRMRARAEHEPGDKAQRLRDEADRLEQAIEERGGEGGIPRLVGAWARARRVWCEVTGEPVM